MSRRDRLVEFAKMQLGIHENPRGSNVVKYNDWFYDRNSPYYKNPRPYAWCGTFVAYVYHFSDNMLESQLNDIIGYVPSAQNWLRKNDKLAERPMPGDIIIFDWDKDGFEEHIGIYLFTEGDYYYTIEGNTSPDEVGSQSNGGMVCRKRRHNTLVEGIYNVID